MYRQMAFLKTVAGSSKALLAVRMSPVTNGCTQSRMYARSSIKCEPLWKECTSEYLEELYDAWREDPSSVNEVWNEFFKKCAYQHPASLNPNPCRSLLQKGSRSLGNSSNLLSCENKNSSISAHMAIQGIIRAYQVRGHLLAQLDPLGILVPDFSSADGKLPPDVISHLHKIDECDLNEVFQLPVTTSIGDGKKELSGREILARLHKAYCCYIGIEYMFINNQEKCQWIRDKIEAPGTTTLSDEEKKLCLNRLIEAGTFENFLATKYPTEKRFGLEGCEVLIPALKSIIDRSTLLGVNTFVFGMPHRGRMNVLANVCQKPLPHILTQFVGLTPADLGSGDVKYHMGVYIERKNRVTKKDMRLILVANPSHLETVSPVVQGRVRAEQHYMGDREGKQVLSILLHGDAAFSGQGVVYETVHLSELPAYTTYGTIHVVVNNQVGYTTDPRFSRSSTYCTDVGKVTDAPIFHVNADQPEAVIYVANMAAEWRARYHKDVVIDLVCYRKNGHSEMDEPMFTQPLMYKKIRTMTPIYELYAQKLIEENVVTREHVEKVKNDYNKVCEEAYQIASKEKSMKFSEWIDSPWPNFFKKDQPLILCPTGVSEDTIMSVGKVFACPPKDNPDFVIHKGIEKILADRMEMLNKRTVDFATAEAIAFGTLVKEGIHVRVSGQDVERGTFSHRHHVLHHQNIDKAVYIPLANVDPNQSKYHITNSSLAEYAVVAFELGYSMANPHALVVWEAQFGDFGNVAQCVIDLMLSSGESKWVRQSGLTVYMPHGMEGGGPEHSSARLERFLQLTAEDPDTYPAYKENFAINQLKHINWIVAIPSTPANMFHLLRRQMIMPFRKPLVVLTPKSLLRNPSSRSSFDDMIDGTEFQRVIPDCGKVSENPGCVEKAIFCAGKRYFDIVQLVKEKHLEEKISVTRIEQLTPFPFDLVKQECEKYENANLVWVQEEHKNQGAWTYVQPRIKTCCGGCRDVSYVGRPVSASTATGNKVIFDHEVKEFMAEAIKLC